MSDDLVAFLRARLDEEWADVELFEATKDIPEGGRTEHGYAWSKVHAFSRKVSADVDAKRRIIDRYEGQHWHGPAIAGATSAELRQEEAGACRTCITNRLLALPYADHPDYRDEWRP